MIHSSEACNSGGSACPLACSSGRWFVQCFSGMSRGGIRVLLGERALPLSHSDKSSLADAAWDTCLGPAWALLRTLRLGRVQDVGPVAIDESAATGQVSLEFLVRLGFSGCPCGTGVHAASSQVGLGLSTVWGLSLLSQEEEEETLFRPGSRPPFLDARLWP